MVGVEGWNGKEWWLGEPEESLIVGRSIWVDGERCVEPYGAKQGATGSETGRERSVRIRGGIMRRR
jgi:hypothetical protein